MSVEGIVVSETVSEVCSDTKVPSFSIDATNRFAPILVRMFADLMLNIEGDKSDEFLELCELSNAMDEWRAGQVEK
jgi:hypothetical protein